MAAYDTLLDGSLYEMLKVPSSASDSEIRNAIGKMRQKWSARTTGNYQAVQRARRIVDRCGEAERILLDPHARASYDKSLNQPSKIPKSQGSEHDWFVDVKRYIADQDWEMAFVVGQKAEQQGREDPEKLYWCCYACVMSKHWNEAIRCARQMAAYAPKDSRSYCARGTVQIMKLYDELNKSSEYNYATNRNNLLNGLPECIKMYKKGLSLSTSINEENACKLGIIFTEYTKVHIGEGLEVHNDVNSVTWQSVYDIKRIRSIVKEIDKLQIDYNSVFNIAKGYQSVSSSIWTVMWDMNKLKVSANQDIENMRSYVSVYLRMANKIEEQRQKDERIREEERAKAQREQQEYELRESVHKRIYVWMIIGSFIMWLLLVAAIYSPDPNEIGWTILLFTGWVPGVALLIKYPPTNMKSGRFGAEVTLFLLFWLFFTMQVTNVEGMYPWWCILACVFGWCALIIKEF